jgi:hypothetical protein
MTTARRTSTLAASLSIAMGLAAGFASGCEGSGSAIPLPPSGGVGGFSGGCVAAPPGVVFDGGCATFLPPPIAPQPSFGPTVEAKVAPPPISGGTLLVSHDGNTAVASDPSRDQVYVVDMTQMSLKFTIALNPGDEPGRLAEDAAGRVHVALRRGGALVAIDPAKGTIVSRRAVCPAPRGVTWDAASDRVWVACATGELVALPSSGGAAAISLVVERDMRDVIVQADGSLTVTKFRSAEVLRVRGDGSVSRRDSLTSAPRGRDPETAQVAWRMIGGPAGGQTVSVYQVESSRSITTSVPGGYGGGSGPVPNGAIGGGFTVGVDSGTLSFDASSPLAPIPPVQEPESIVRTELTVLGSDGSSVSRIRVPRAVLPVDIALSPDGSQVAVACAGNAFTPMPSVYLVSLGATPGIIPSSATQQALAVAFGRGGDLVVQTGEPATLVVIPNGTGAMKTIALSSVSFQDTGHDIFHAQAGGLIACASCHPEGGDDGHVWLLDGLPRRTPSLRGTIAGTAPYHWPGEEKDMSMLIDDVYSQRMSGVRLDPGQQGALTTWVESIPAPAAPSWIDHSAAQRGKTLFEGSAQCASCHSGAKFTNNATLDVGTGTDVGGIMPDGGGPPTAFQVPPLTGVGWRTPLFHNGCATSMADRFGKCATPQHGSTGHLSQGDVSDLTTYLESL